MGWQCGPVVVCVPLGARVLCCDALLPLLPLLPLLQKAAAAAAGETAALVRFSIVFSRYFSTVPLWQAAAGVCSFGGWLFYPGFLSAELSAKHPR